MSNSDADPATSAELQNWDGFAGPAATGRCSFRGVASTASVLPVACDRSIWWRDYCEALLSAQDRKNIGLKEL